MEKIKELFNRYRSIILYIIVGGMTTLVNWVVYYVNLWIFKLPLEINNPIAWAVSVVFAYFPNKYWVFENHEKNQGVRQFVKFAGSRVTTFLIEQVLLMLAVYTDWLSEAVAKVIVSVIVVVLNYIFSKILVFKGEEHEM